jgi:CBS domain containing-hemolysin-like protein
MVQIVALDAVFSIDSILTAVGMANQLPVMMVAVIIAMTVMLLASKRLTELINAHPPLIILCLGFLLMIGLSLMAEGVGFQIPKGYLYAAIGFSILIESFNQIALRNRRRSMAKIPPRERVAQAMLHLLSGVSPDTVTAESTVKTMALDGNETEVFAPAEKQMIRDVLGLAGRSVASIMTPRRAVAWIDLHEPEARFLAAIRNSRHAQLLVGRGSIDTVVGVICKQDLLDLCLDQKEPDVQAAIRPPVILSEGVSILKTLELFKRTPVHVAVIVDEYSTVLGVVTQTDLLEAIAGDLPESDTPDRG